MDDSYANVVATPGGGQSAIANVTATRVGVTAATAADSLTLPQAAPGLSYDIVATGATNSVNVFPFKGDTINVLSVNAAFALAPAKSVTFVCVAPGQWFTNPRVAS